MRESADVAQAAGFLWGGVTLLGLAAMLVVTGDIDGAADALRDVLGPVDPDA